MRRKVNDEAQCRACGLEMDLEAAHIIARSQSIDPLMEEALNCIPLCTHCHRQYDHRDLDILSLLTVPEQGHAVLMAGGVMTMLRRVTGERWVPEGRAT